MKNNIYYWSPCLEKVGTYWSTLNSAISMARYKENYYSVKILNICGEWDSKKEYLRNNNIELINIGLNYFKFLPKTGFFRSRFSYIVIFLLSFFPLIKILKKSKQGFFVAHLVSSLPLFLFNIINTKLKLILRISGHPKLNIIRKIFWKFSSKKIVLITCPSEDLLKQLKKKNIFCESKSFFLADPILNIKNFRYSNRNLKENIAVPLRKYFISVGRLTKQKNFLYLINEFHIFSKKEKDTNLLIFGEGEDKKSLNDLIIKLDLTKRIFLMGYSRNIYRYMKNARAFILSSLWEDPGFVLVEAGMSNIPIISSNCKNGPIEFLDNGKAGILFQNNKKGALSDALNFFNEDEKFFFNKLKAAKKNCMKYTFYRHFKIFDEILTKY